MEATKNNLILSFMEDLQTTPEAGKTLFYSRILGNAPADYANASAAAGAFMEIYNTYLIQNNIF